MDDENIAQFTSITGASTERAEQYLRLTDGNIEQAIELYFTSDGVDLEGSTSAPRTETSQAPPIPPAHTRPANSRPGYFDEGGIVRIESDEDASDDDTPKIIGVSRRQPSANVRSTSSAQTPSGTPPAGRPSRAVDDDEAMARRLQEEFYAGGEAGDFGDTGGVRAPIASTRETLVGPGSYAQDGDEDEDEMRAAVMEQMRARRAPQRGIFGSTTMDFCGS